MPVGVRVRSAGPADAEAVTDCQSMCWREAYAGVVGADYLSSAEIERRRLARWRERLAGGPAVWLAKDGTGLAERLLRAAVGSGPASLWVFAANARAQRFYARHGFVADGAEQVDVDTGLKEIRMVRSQIEPRGTTHSQD